MSIPRLLVFLFVLAGFAAVAESSDSKIVNTGVSSSFQSPCDTFVYLENDLSRKEQDILALINTERRKSGLSMLWIDKELQIIARRYSRKMADEKFFGHYDSRGESVGERIRKVRGWSFRFKKIGENLFFSTKEKDLPKISVKQWMKSVPHRKNILDSLYKYTGIGIAQSRDGSIYVTQIFLAE